MTNTMIEGGKDEALIQARRNEKTDPDNRWYVVRRQDGAGWLQDWMLTDTMPLLGEWYDSDGHRHG